MNQQASQEPSMEEILASIRRIISEDKKPVRRPSASAGKSSSFSEESDILELHDPVSDNIEARQNGYSRGSLNGQASQAKPKPPSPSLLSEATVTASRDAFKNLDRPLSGSLGNRSLEEVVEYALRPFLKEWLDANLPTLVKQVVREQVDRITRSRT